MTTRSANSVFLDTNILVYSSVAESAFHSSALQAIETREQAGVELWISRQVLREYLATLTRPQGLKPPSSISVLAPLVRSFESRFHVAEDDSMVTAQLLALLEQIPAGGKQIHDANLVATMLVYNIRHLLTHNTADFARFAPLITVLPLIPPPARGVS